MEKSVPRHKKIPRKADEGFTKTVTEDGFADQRS